MRKSAFLAVFIFIVVSVIAYQVLSQFDEVKEPSVSYESIMLNEVILQDNTLIYGEAQIELTADQEKKLREEFKHNTSFISLPSSDRRLETALTPEEKSKKKRNEQFARLSNIRRHEAKALEEVNTYSKRQAEKMLVLRKIEIDSNNPKQKQLKEAAQKELDLVNNQLKAAKKKHNDFNTYRMQLEKEL